MQVGLPANAEQYIHRLGRTARAGAAGRGLLVLAPFESFFLRKGEMRDLPLKPHPQNDALNVGDAGQSSFPGLAQARNDVRAALGRVDDETKAQAYQAQ